MVDMSAYKQKVHRSLLQREMLGGVPQAGLILLIVLSTVFIYGMRMYFMIVPIAVLYIVMRALTKRDQWLIDIVLDNIQQKDKLIP
ncbi:MAG: VirB3 family type IV secretion system protein [Treponema sp.]|jgi:type IV secretory pathway VirB3-like protein|nr:VirB3 family type IV secretion system protein [Treponema sp.]